MNIEQIQEQEISKSFIKKFLPDDAIVLEAGAHIGRDTVKMAIQWPNCTIYSFEPVKELFEKLKENTQNLTNVNCFNYALSNEAKESKIYISKGRSTALSSLLKPVGALATHPETEFIESTVNTITIDAWASQNNVARIDFMWLDMQGAELQALEGADYTLQKTTVIFAEASLVDRYENAPHYRKLIEFLTDKNFIPIARDIPKHGKVNILFQKIIQ